MQIVAPILAEIARRLDVPVVRAGLLVSSYALGSAVAAPLFAPAVARRGALSLLEAGLAVLAAGTALCAAAPSFSILLAGRVVAGIGGGLAMTMCHVYVAQAVPYEERGRAVGWLASGFFSATILGVPAGAALAEFFSWRATFWILVAAALLVAVPLRRLPRTESATPFRWSDFGAILRARGVIPGLAAFTLLSAVFSSVTTYFGSWVEGSFGARPSLVGGIFLLGGLAALAGGPIGGRIADRIGKRPVAVFGNAAMGVFLALLPRSGRIEIAALCFAGAFLSASIRFPAMMAMLTEAVPREGRGPLLLANHTAILTGLALGSWGGGQILAVRGFGTVGAMAGVLTLAIISLLFFLPDPGRGGETESVEPLA